MESVMRYILPKHLRQTKTVVTHTLIFSLLIRKKVTSKLNTGICHNYLRFVLFLVETPKLIFGLRCRNE